MVETLITQKTVLLNGVEYRQVRGDLPILEGGRLSWVSASQVNAGEAGQKSVVRDSTFSVEIAWTGLISGIMPTDLDTGSETSNTWYAVHVIGNSENLATSPVKLLLSLSATAPVLPSGYDVFRRIGWVRNNGTSNLLKFFQIGKGAIRRIHYDEPGGTLVVLTGGSATAFAAVSLAALVPPGSQDVFLGVSFNNSVVGGLGTDDIRLRPTGSTVTSSVTRVQPGSVLLADMQMPLEMVTNTSQSIEYRVSQATNTASIAVQGYIDEL